MAGGDDNTNVAFISDYHNDSQTDRAYNVNLSSQLVEDGAGGSRSRLVLVGTTLGVLDLLTVLGNLLVCVTIASTRRLHNATNYLIFSLALSDLLLGILVLPFSTLNTLLPDAWPLGATFCNLFVSMDVMLCTVSILNLFAISLDRYFAVTKPYEYCRMTTNRRVISLLVIIWVFSFVMAFLPIHLGWNTSGGHIQNTLAPSYCLLEGNPYYVLLVSLATYFVPLVVMCCVYIKVFAIVKQQVRQIQKMVVTRYHVDRKGSGNCSTGICDGSPRRENSLSTPSPNQRQAASESKATVTLGSVVLAFSICWIPYFVLFTARPFVSKGFNPTVDLFVLWLGYVNSMLNPFLYAFINSEFRYGFMWVLCRQWAISQREKSGYFV